MTDRAFSTIFQETLDAASAWQASTDYTDASGQRDQFSIEVPAAGGPFVTLDGITLTAGRTVNLIYPAPGLTSGATFDAAEALKANYVGEASTGSVTVERLVFTHVIAGGVGISNGAFTRVSLGRDLTGIETLKVDITDGAGTHLSPIEVHLSRVTIGQNQGALLHWYGTTYLRMRVVSAADLANGDLEFFLAGGAGNKIQEIRGYAI